MSRANFALAPGFTTASPRPLGITRLVAASENTQMMRPLNVAGAWTVNSTSARESASTLVHAWFVGGISLGSWASASVSDAIQAASRASGQVNGLIRRLLVWTLGAPASRERQRPEGSGCVNSG